jgi:hypothetical protein
MISTTQTTNFLSLAGALVVILGYFDIKIDVNDLAMLIGACMTILGILLNFYHRYQKGDITALGIRTQIVDNTSSEQG